MSFVAFFFLCLVSRASRRVLCSEGNPKFPDWSQRHGAVCKNVALELAGGHWHVQAQPWTAAAAAAAQPGSARLCECCLSTRCGPAEPQPASVPERNKRECRGVGVDLICPVLPQRSPAKSIPPRSVSSAFPWRPCGPVGAVNRAQLVEMTTYQGASNITFKLSDKVGITETTGLVNQ